ncbi:MAG: alpha/beta hydrolase [Acutalibacteraceae bacterium]|nr:alpha/beta hydrolase [Acutalibacteraceae bacterium]
MNNILAYVQLGDKNSENTLVFLHGSTMTKEGMLPLAEEFEAYNCISLDLTAHGESGGELPKSISDIAEDVENTIEHLRKMNIIQEKVILLGYSMGGAIICEVALRKKIKTNGIVFLGSGADLKHYTPAVDQLKEMPVEDFKTKDILDFLFGDLVDKSEEDRIKNAFLETKVSDEIGYNDLMISNAYDCIDKAKNIDCPTLLVHGCEDKIVLPATAVETWKQIQNSQLLMMPYGGHALIYEDTTIVAEKIKGFVEKVL